MILSVIFKPSFSLLLISFILFTFPNASFWTFLCIFTGSLVIFKVVTSTTTKHKPAHRVRSCWRRTRCSTQCRHGEFRSLFLLLLFFSNTNLFVSTNLLIGFGAVDVEHAVVHNIPVPELRGGGPPLHPHWFRGLRVGTHLQGGPAWGY